MYRSVRCSTIRANHFGSNPAPSGSTFTPAFYPQTVLPAQRTHFCVRWRGKTSRQGGGFDVGEDVVAFTGRAVVGHAVLGDGDRARGPRTWRVLRRAIR